jgi:hypothetical protein
MPGTACFSYPADVPPGAGIGGVSRRPRPGVRRMPLTCYSYPLSCFAYPDDMPSATGHGDASQPPPPGMRRMPSSTCFRY